MPHEIVDDSLVDALAGARRNERVPKDVEPAQDAPLRVINEPAEVM